MAIGKGFSLSDVVNGAIGNFPGNCMGYMNPGASGSGYIATMKLSVDKVDMTGLDPGAGGIVSYDRCEKDDAYIGQINMGTASSFCGVNGALWGLHLAVAPSIKDGSVPTRTRAAWVPDSTGRLSASPLLMTARRSPTFSLRTAGWTALRAVMPPRKPRC